MPLLRISDVPLGEGRRRVEVTWQDGSVRQVAVSSFAYQMGESEAEKIRWYLEDYSEFPADPAPRLAADAERILADMGAGLFSHVFSGMDAAGIWVQARAQLGHVRVEVDADPAEVPGLPWELLRDPGTDTALALGAGTFVRTHLQATARAGSPQAGADTLRVLMVICRPGGRDDVPFRSVASRLVRGGAVQMQGLELDVLRPATYARLARVLHEAADAGHPYHVVHFDGHGTYLDLTGLQQGSSGGDDDQAGVGGMAASESGGIRVSPLRYGISVVGPVRTGKHGYLIFEDPSGPANQQFVDGPTLGRLLASTGVPVLVLNACRSAYTEALEHPGGPPSQAYTGSSLVVGNSTDAAALADVHARIRAYGSLAAEVADTGVPGVVAMRYSVYVVTAAQYMADLYAHLLAGRSLGQAATAARRALADDPIRQITTTPVALQDWAVPLVYEAAPLTLLQPGTRDAPLIHLSLTDATDGAGASGAGPEGLPRPPDVGFFGRDETLLALDRTFDTQQVALLEAFAGAGKSATAAEFGRWYQETGGLYHPAVGHGPVLWSSFEHHLPLDRLLDTVGERFAGLLEASGIPWQAITDPIKRRAVVLQVLAQVPALWVWDNTESVTGFPSGSPSAWTPVEQDKLASFLRDLAQRTRCKVLVTSRRSEKAWLADLPARLQLPPMPMRECLQLTHALAARHGGAAADVDWRPLLRYTAGNPLTITVVVGQALHDNLDTTEQIEAFVARLQVGVQQLEAGEDAALGRTRSLAASLTYGFTHAFTEAERNQLALLHLFRDTIDADMLRMMGDPEIIGDDAVAELGGGLARDASVALLDRAAEIGLLTHLRWGYYAIHPALPWYFTTIFTAIYGESGNRAERPARAYTRAIAEVSRYYSSEVGTGSRGFAFFALKLEEANLRHALNLALVGQRPKDAVGCLEGLHILYRVTGRNGEWARIVEQVASDFVDPLTGLARSGREQQWRYIIDYWMRLAADKRDWPTATRFAQSNIAWQEKEAARALTTPNDQLTSEQHRQIQNLAVAKEWLAHILRWQDDPSCIQHYHEAIALVQRTPARGQEASTAMNLGNAYYEVSGIRDIDLAERWFRHSLDLTSDDNPVGQAASIGSIAAIAYERFLSAHNAGAPSSVQGKFLQEALDGYQGALRLIPDDDAENLAVTHNQIGLIFSAANDIRQALHHYQEAIKWKESRGDIFGAGRTRIGIARLLARNGQFGDALHYAHAALQCFERTGLGATEEATEAHELIANLEEDIELATRVPADGLSPTQYRRHSSRRTSLA